MRTLERLRIVGERVTKSWENYWFHHDASLSLGIVRIAVGISALWTLGQSAPADYRVWLTTLDPRSYNPKGALAFFGSALPDPAFFEWAGLIALVSTIAFTIGFLTRIALLLSIVSNLIVLGALESFITGWSHGNNIVLLAMMAMLCAPGHQALSVDAFRRTRTLHAVANASSDPGSRAAPPILLAQIVIGLLFLNAAWWKIRTSGYSLDWALSDNFRHILLVQYPRLGRDMPRYLQWVADHEFAYKGLAMGNLVLQAAPILACVAIRRPMLRAALGLAFVAEIAGLGVVMSIWNPQWLPLYAIYVDWDALWRRRRIKPRAARRVTTISAWPHAAVSFFVLTFMGWFVTVAFLLPRGKHFDLNVYPFSQFKMYSEIKAKLPYSQHQTYEVFGVTFELHCDEPPRRIRQMERLLQRHFYYAPSFLTYDRILSSLGTVRGFLREELNLSQYQVSMYRTVFQAPAYPAKADLRIVHRGLMAVTDSDGREEVVFARRRVDPNGNNVYLETQHIGYSDPVFQFSYILDLVGPVKPLPGMMLGDRYYYSTPEAGRYLMVVTAREKAGGAGEPAVYFCDYPFHTSKQ